MSTVTVKYSYSSIDAVTSSFAGGALLTINGNNLGLNKIYVCSKS